MDFKSLQNGSSKKIKEWQAKLSDVGAFTVQPQQTQTSENTPAGPSLKERLNQFLANAKAVTVSQDTNNASQATATQADDQPQQQPQPQAQPVQSQPQEQVQEQPQQKKAPNQEKPKPLVDVNDKSSKSVLDWDSFFRDRLHEAYSNGNEEEKNFLIGLMDDSGYFRDTKENHEALIQRYGADEINSSFQKMEQRRELLKTPSPKAFIRQQEQEQPQDNEQTSQQPVIQETTPENAPEQSQPQIQEPATQEQPQETQPQQTQEQEQPKAQEQEKPKPKTLEERLVSKANSPISKHRTTRIEHGKAIARLAKKADVDIPKPVETSLETGNAKAIEEARRIINERFVNDQAQQAQERYRQRVAEQSRQAGEQAQLGLLQAQTQAAQNQQQEVNQTQPQEQPKETTQPQSNGRYGNSAEVITGSRKPHQIRYKVFEADELNSSHVIDNGGVFANNSYPTELQPRDRARSNMQAQLISMGNNLSPNDLLDARDVNQGAPVIRNDGVVLNGNGRTAAIRYAYENGKGGNYKNALIQNAQRFGLNADEISKMNRPVLVRELANNLSEDELRDVTGTQTGGARMGASEQAQADAKRISNETLGIFPQSDNVDLTKAESADFLRAALNDIATPDELNSLTTNNGQVNQDGINRVKRAIFALAYGDDGLISRMSESTDDNVRGATNALLTAAPSIATVQSGMKNGTLHNYDLSAIANAVKRLAALRDEGKTVSNYLQEQSLFADQADSDETREILTTLDRNKRAPNKIATFLKKIASNIQAQGDPRQGSLFGENEPAPLIDLIRKARQDVEGGGQANLFAQEQKQSEQKTSTQPQQNSTEAQGTSTTETSKAETQQAQETAPETQQQNSKAESETQTPETSKPQKESTVEPKGIEQRADDALEQVATDGYLPQPSFDTRELKIESGTNKKGQPAIRIVGKFPSKRDFEELNRRLNYLSTTLGGSVADKKGTFRFKNQEDAQVFETALKKFLGLSPQEKQARATAGKERKQAQEEKAKAGLEAKVAQISDDETRAKAQRFLNAYNKGMISLSEATNGIEKLINPQPVAKRKKKSASRSKGESKSENSIDDKTLNEAAKNPDTANALKQLGAEIKDGKVVTPDEETRKAVETHIKTMTAWHGSPHVFDDKAIKILEKLSLRGDGDTTIANFVAPEDLTPQQKMIQSFGEKLGIKTVFFRNDNADFHGAHAGNISYINVNSEMPIGKVFWHESMHWLKASNPKLYQQLVKAAGITDEQRQAYLEKTERADLYTDAEIDEEIIADQFEDVAKRNGLLQSIAGKNRGLVERVVQWLKDTMNKFIEFFHNPQGKLTTKQKQALADEFGKIATRLVDPNGERIFRYNRRTHNLETIGGRSMAKTTPLSEVGDVKYAFAGKKAKTANKESLARAKKMDDRGVDRNRIYEATGWFKGRDRKWRFEIPDNLDQMNFDKLHRIKDFFFPLDEIYDNPALFDAYPDLKNLQVSSKVFKDSATHGFVRGNKITLNWNDINDGSEEVGKAIVHEIQHVIQDFETFSSGGTESNVLTQLKDNMAAIKRAVAQIPNKNAKKVFNTLTIAFSNARFAREYGDEEELLQESESIIKTAAKGFSPKAKADIEYLAERYSELSDTVDEIRDAKGEYDEDTGESLQKGLKLDAYDRLGGEQEARAVGERLFNRNGTPKPHDSDALIVFHGKSYAFFKQRSANKKNAFGNGDGELATNDGDIRGQASPSAATADGTTNHWSPTSLQRVDNKGGVNRFAHVETNSPRESILQGAGEIKYSLGRSNNSSESLTQKIRNAFSSWWKGGAKKNRNREITDLLYRVTGYKVDFGNVKDADKTIIDDVHKVIRAKHAYEWDKLLPQIGGKIAKSLKLNPTQEMSNYIADWCMTGAVGNQSAEAKAFEKAMRNDPVTAGLMLQIRESFQEFNDMTAEQKIGSTIVSRLQGKSPREIARTLWSDKEEEISDDLHPVLRQINDMIAKAEKTSPTLAKMMKEDINPYQMMRLLRGIGGLGDLMIGTEKVKDIEDVRDQFRAIYPRLKFDRLVTLDMIVDMAGGKKHVDGLMKYAVAKLDKEMHEKLREDPEADIRPQFSEAVDDEVIKNGEKQYAEAHRALVTYSNILLCIRHDAGLIGDRSFTKAIKGWKNYIPMIRLYEDDKEFTIEDSLKHKTGSQRSSYNALETLTQNTYDILSRAERNKAKQQLAFYARIGEFGDIIQEVETSNPSNNVISFREGGKIKYLKVFDPAVKRAVDNIYSPADTSWIMKFLRATMNIVRNMRTMGSPDFAIGNLPRDIQDAYIHNRHADVNPLKALLDVFREGFKGFGFKRVFREKSLVPHDTDWAEFNALGGTQSTFVSEDVDQLRRSMNKLTRKTFMESFKEAPLHTVLDRLQWLSEQTEYMTRLNSYKRAKAELAKQHGGKATLADKRLAALEARDASIDFAKAGTSTRKVNQLLMFANAQVQDWAKWGVIGRDYFKGGEARKVALQKIGRLVLTGVVATLLQAALNRSDDDRKEKYKKRPDWEKETYWIFGDGVRIPKGQDIATRFVSALTDEFIDKAMDDDPVSGKRLLKVIRDAVPSIIPSLIEPVDEVRKNYSAFRDAPIVPVGQQRLDTAEQYGRYTSSFAKLFSEMTGLTSPRGVDYLISGYLGSTGRFFTQLPDYMFGRGMTLNDVLMVRRFVFDPAENTKTVKEYYEAYDEQYKHYNTYKLRRKWDKTAKPHEDFDPKFYARLQAAQEPLSKISAAENNILRNPKLDWDTKNKKIRELEKKREKICEKIMHRAR